MIDCCFLVWLDACHAFIKIFSLILPLSDIILVLQCRLLRVLEDLHRLIEGTLYMLDPLLVKASLLVIHC